MKKQLQYKTGPNCLFGLANLLPAGMIVMLCLFSTPLFSQGLDIVTPSTNTTYRLPDPDGLLSPEAVKGAIVTAELAGRALNADAAVERSRLATAESDLNKAETMKSDYLVGLNNYTKNGYDPYMVDYNNYTPNYNNYDAAVTRHNNAVAASDALPAAQRSATTVASLNSEKTELDLWKSKLDNWKATLDAAKAKLDAQREVLLQQKAQFEAANQNAQNQIKASRLRLKGILDQLILCSYYADKCNSILVTKFKVNPGSSTTGYFGTPVYKGSIADLNTDLERLKHLSGVVWDGN